MTENRQFKSIWLCFLFAIERSDEINVYYKQCCYFRCSVSERQVCSFVAFRSNVKH